MIPGSNILNMALSAISPSQFEYYAFAGRTPNEVGQDVTTYEAPQTLRGSVQPVPRTLYQIDGLDSSRDYFTFYVSKDILDIARDISGDQMFFNGKTFQCVSKTDWFALDGWDAILTVRVLSNAR